MFTLIEDFVIPDPIEIGIYMADDRYWVNCNDLFFWGCADSEEITEDNILDLSNALEECEALGCRNEGFGLFVARRRGMRPQGAAYPSKPELVALYDACGPKRETGLGNPEPQP